MSRSQLAATLRAQATALREQATTLSSLADIVDSEQPTATPRSCSPRYADLHEHGAGVYRAALRDIRSGKLRAYEAARGKRLVLLDDWHRWLEAHPVQVSAPAEQAAASAEPRLDVSRLIELGDARRRARA